MPIALIAAAKPAATAAPFYTLKDLDFDHPFCEGHADLSVGADTFIEIENPLRGTNDYNHLIKTYQAKDWPGLNEEIETFRRVHETSPLMEAVAFVEAQGALDQLRLTDEEGLKKVEGLIRQAFLLYPKSTFVPVLSLNLANFYLSTEAYNRSLALYSSVKNDYPFHTHACIALYGVAETNYHARDRGAAQRGFEQVLQKCDSVRLQVGAKNRLLDLRREQGESLAVLDKAYTALYEKHGLPLSRFSPAALMNLGELRYRRKVYPSARFFYKEFQRFGPRETTCLPWAQKRLADISLRSKEETLPDSIGKYLVVREKYPQAEISLYSYIHGLLLDFSTQSPAEQDRRIQVIDSKIEGIKDRKLETAIFLEKGLALLEIGQKNALEYLLRMNERTELNLQKGELGDFVRTQLLKILDDEVKSVTAKGDAKKDRRIFEPLESAYVTWLKGSPFESQARGLYREMILRRFDEAIENGNLSSAIGKLRRWEESELSPGERVDRGTRLHVGSKIASLWIKNIGKDMKAMAKVLQDQTDTLEPFLHPEFDGFWVAAALATEEKSRVEALLAEKKGRGPASVNKDLSQEVQSYLHLVVGRGYRLLGKKDKAERSLKSVTASSLVLVSEEERLGLYKEQRENVKLVELGLKVLEKLPVAEKKTHIGMLKEAVLEGKLWKSGVAVLKAAQKAELDEKELASYYVLAGRSQYELSDCSEAIPTLTRAFTLNSDLPEKAETKFRMGKCYFRLRDKERARKAWTEVQAMKDPFWSPLATNELRLVEP